MRPINKISDTNQPVPEGLREAIKKALTVYAQDDLSVDWLVDQLFALRSSGLSAQPAPVAVGGEGIATVAWGIGIPDVKEGGCETFWCAVEGANGKTFHRFLEYANRHIMPLADGIEDEPEGVESVPGDEGNYYWTGWHECSCDQCDTQWMFSQKVLAWMRLPKLAHSTPPQVSAKADEARGAQQMFKLPKSAILSPEEVERFKIGARRVVYYIHDDGRMLLAEDSPASPQSEKGETATPDGGKTVETDAATCSVPCGDFSIEDLRELFRRERVKTESLEAMRFELEQQRDALKREVEETKRREKLIAEELFLLQNRVMHAAGPKEAKSACEQMMTQNMFAQLQMTIDDLRQQLSQAVSQQDEAKAKNERDFDHKLEFMAQRDGAERENADLKSALTAAQAELEGLRKEITGAADELGNMLFRFDTVVEALRQAVMIGKHALTEQQANEKANAMLAVAAPSRAKLAELNALLTRAASVEVGK